MELVLFCIVFIAALGARIIRRIRPQDEEWLYWLAGFWFVAVLVALIITNYIFVIVASLLGFLAPALWHSLETFVRGSRAVAVIALLIIGFFLYFLDPPFMEAAISKLLVLGVVVVGIWIMIRLLLRR